MITIKALTQLTRDQAIAIADAAHAVPKTLANYPRVPTAGTGVPGGGQPFTARTASGSYSCVLIDRGSDFLIATCHQGSSSTSFVDSR